VAGGQILSDSVLHAALVEMRPMPHLPGLIEGLVGRETFSAASLELDLPADYPAPELASVRATFFVEARRVFALEMPALDDPAALCAAGLGADLESAMEALAREADAELGDEMLVAATEAVLDALAERTEADIPRALVDEELRRRWDGGPGQMLANAEFPAAFQAGAREAFLGNLALRAEAYRRLRIGLALGALVKREGLAPQESDVAQLMAVAAERVGISVAEAKRAVAGQPQEARQVFDTALYLAAVEFVMARAKVNVV